MRKVYAGARSKVRLGSLQISTAIDGLLYLHQTDECDSTCDYCAVEACIEQELHASVAGTMNRKAAFDVWDDDSAISTARLKALEARRCPPGTLCEHCQRNDTEIRWESSRTMYDWDPKSGKPDPNRDSALCRECAVEHHDYWTDMWDEYNSGRF